MDELRVPTRDALLFLICSACGPIQLEPKSAIASTVSGEWISQIITRLAVPAFFYPHLPPIPTCARLLSPRSINSLYFAFSGISPGGNGELVWATRHSGRGSLFNILKKIRT